MSSRSAWSKKHVPKQPRLHRETLSQNKQTPKTKQNKSLFLLLQLKHFHKESFQGWRDGLETKTACCSWRGHIRPCTLDSCLGIQYPGPPWTPVRQCTHPHTDTHTHNLKKTFILKTKNLVFLKQILNGTKYLAFLKHKFKIHALRVVEKFHKLI